MLCTSILQEITEIPVTEWGSVWSTELVIQSYSSRKKGPAMPLLHSTGHQRSHQEGTLIYNDLKKTKQETKSFSF